jgi:hypothetical protein
MTGAVWPSQAAAARLLVGAGYAVYCGGELLRVVATRAEADDLIDAVVKFSLMAAAFGWGGLCEGPLTWRALTWTEYETLRRQQEERDR